MGDPVFNVDVLDAAGVIQGAGPLVNVSSVEITEELDRAGRVAVMIPATYQRAIDLLAAECQLRIRVLGSGLVATGLVQELDVVTAREPQFQVAGPDLLGELVYLNTGYRNAFNNQATAAAIIGSHATPQTLLYQTGWTAGTISPSITPTTIEYDGQTILEALITLAEQIGDHFRQGNTARTLDWGVFGSHSGVRITNVYHALVAQAAGNAALAYLSGAQIGTISTELENRIFPLGKDKFDLRDATAASTGILVATNKGPAGAATTLTANLPVGTNPIPVASTTGFTAGEEIFIGTWNSWASNHEVATIQTVGAGSLTLTAATTVTHTSGQDVLQRPQFYVENAASQALYGLREACPSFAWIGPLDTTVLTDRQRAADVLYAAAQARLLRYQEPYRNYTLNNVYGLPYSLRVGDKVRVVCKGAIAPQGQSYYVDVDEDLYVLKITRKLEANGTQTAALEVASVARPAPNNANLVIYNLDLLRWVGVR